MSDNGKKRQELAPGDFALIPAYVRTRQLRLKFTLMILG